MKSDTSPVRMTCLDAYRGFVMFLMLAEVLHLKEVEKKLPDSVIWNFLAYHQSHVDWTGCTLHDLIQPSFSMLVGAALPFSLAARAARGDSRTKQFFDAFVRSFILIVLGIFLRSIGKPQTNYTFEDTLTQIGLGYPFLFLIGLGKPIVRWLALGIILFGYWLAFALYPSGESPGGLTINGVPSDWIDNATGFARHWNKNDNLAFQFDVWFLNLFPRVKPFEFNSGGYATLSFIPTLGTMILGIIASDILRSDRDHRGKLITLLALGTALFGIGFSLGQLGICPVVKRIWTPSWVLSSGGLCFLLLSFFYLITEWFNGKRIVVPLLVIGSNSIAAYVMDWLFVGFIRDALARHLPEWFYNWAPEALLPLWHGALVLGVLWLLLLWLYRKRIFIKI